MSKNHTLVLFGVGLFVAALTIAASAQNHGAALGGRDHQVNSVSTVRTPSAVHSQAASGEYLDNVADGVTWTQLSFPSNVPPARSYPSMTYDPVSRKIVLFGGYSYTTYLQDTWTFDGVTWSKEVPAISPPARCAAAMAFDRGSRKVVLFGGFNGQILGDSWTWDGASSTWKKVSSAVSPKAVTGAAGFTDPVTGHADLYGGFDGQFYHLDTYQWSGTAWNKLTPETAAWARSTAIAALNPQDKSVVLFGGLGDINTYNTWTWDGTTWTEQFPDVQPPSRYGSGGAFDPLTGNVIIFGGGAGGSDLNDTWMWTGAGWQQLTPAESPSARQGFGMAYDPAINQVVLFGGNTHFGQLFADTWIFTSGPNR